MTSSFLLFYFFIFLFLLYFYFKSAPLINAHTHKNDRQTDGWTDKQTTGTRNIHTQAYGRFQYRNRWTRWKIDSEHTKRERTHYG